MANHGINVSEQATSVGTPNVAKSGIPFFIGISPIQAAGTPAKIGVPTLATSFEEAKEKLGYSDAWDDFTLCEAMYSHFELYRCQPVIFVNLLDPATMNEAVAANDIDVSNHKTALPVGTINDESLIVKPAGGVGDPYVLDTDYSVFYEGEYCYIELLSDGGAYAATSLNVAYKKVTPTAVNASAVATGLEAIEQCMSTIGIVPDLIVAPGFSHDSSVAAVMATKAAGINGMFRAKPLIDISTAAVGGADEYSKVTALKASNNLTDLNQIVCWPLLKLGNRTFHMSTQMAGLMALVDTTNEGVPYESPSNKAFKADAMVDEAGNEINLTLAQANILNADGVVTALNFMGGLNCWGNYTACFPANTDVKDYFIPLSRMFDWVGNTLINTFWGKLDKPMNRRLIDTILDSNNIWLNGLVGAGYILGARAEFKESENPQTSLMAGILKVHIYMTPPSPAQEIDFVLEYDANYVVAALAG